METFKQAERVALIVALKRAIDFYKRNWKEWNTQDKADVEQLESLLKAVAK